MVRNRSSSKLQKINISQPDADEIVVNSATENVFSVQDIAAKLLTDSCHFNLTFVWGTDPSKRLSVCVFHFRNYFVYLDYIWYTQFSEDFSFNLCHLSTSFSNGTCRLS